MTPDTLRLGLLVCDHVNPSWQAEHGDYPDMFRRLFAERPGVDVVAYDVTAGEWPGSLDDCDAWITTGSRHSVNDDEPWIEELAGFVRRAATSEAPYVGICFGHQMIAHALGGKVEPAARGWGVGVQEVRVPEPPAWLGADHYRIISSHADQIVDLPAGAAVLGGNAHCPVSLIQATDTMIGIQGHPEFTAGYAAALLHARRDGLIPAETADAALATLDGPPDTDLLSAAILRFVAACRQG